MAEYKIELIKKAEDLILDEFPAKILELNDLLAQPIFADRKFEKIYQSLNIPVPEPVAVDEDLNNHHEDPPPTKRAKRTAAVISNDGDAVAPTPGTKVMALSQGMVLCNQPLLDLIKTVKPVIRALVEDSNLLKMWISYLIPKIEDGNNFGVSIQEDTLSEIQSVESESAAFFDQISRYFISRAKIISKVAKYPHIEDYRQAVVVSNNDGDGTVIVVAGR